MNNKKASNLKLYSAFAAVYIIWGSTYLAIRFAIETIPPFIMAGSRFLFAGIVLYLLTYKKNKEKLTPAHFKSTAIIGILLLLGGNGGVCWAEQFVPSGLTALLISTVPIWVMLISFVMPKQKNASLKNVIGVILGFIGLFFLISPEHIIKGSSVDLVGALALIIASLLWSIGSVYSKNADLPKYSLTATALEMFFGGITLLIASLFTGEWSHFNAGAISGKSILGLVYLIIFGSLIAFSAYVWLLSKADPHKVTTYAYVNPVVAVFLGWLLAGEMIDLKVIVSAVIIIAAVVLIITNFSAMRKKPSVHPE